MNIMKENVNRKYGKTVLECNKWRILVKIFVGSNIKVLSKTELDHVLLEYGEILNYSGISTGDEIYYVWNQSDVGIGLKKNAENPTKLRSLMMR